MLFAGYCGKLSHDSFRVFAVQRKFSSMATMATSLSLSHQEEPVDLGDLRCLKNGLGCLNTARAVAFNAFRNAVRNMWRLSSPVEVQQRGVRYLFTFANKRDVKRVKKGGPWAYQRAMIIINDYDGFSDIEQVPLNFLWTWVEILGLPTALTTVATTRLVGETVGPVLIVDQNNINRGIVRVRLTLSLDEPMKIQWRIRVSPIDVLEIDFCNTLTLELDDLTNYFSNTFSKSIFTARLLTQSISRLYLISPLGSKGVRANLLSHPLHFMSTDFHLTTSRETVAHTKTHEQAICELDSGIVITGRPISTVLKIGELSSSLVLPDHDQVRMSPSLRETKRGSPKTIERNREFSPQEESEKPLLLPQRKIKSVKR
ncbi:hypothetical protein ACLB2K_002130 [Fragaria x ananassa]